jgi:hypothetical protein
MLMDDCSYVTYCFDVTWCLLSCSFSVLYIDGEKDQHWSKVGSTSEAHGNCAFACHCAVCMKLSVDLLLTISVRLSFIIIIMMSVDLSRHL